MAENNKELKKFVITTGTLLTLTMAILLFAVAHERDYSKKEKPVASKSSGKKEKLPKVNILTSGTKNPKN